MPQRSNENADSPLSPVSGAPTEVPTDCGRDDASREGDLPTSAAGSWGAEQEALAKKQRLLLDRAYRYLVDQGFGPLELASLDLDESPAMARQLGAEFPLWGLAGRCPLLLATGSPRGG